MKVGYFFLLSPSNIRLNIASIEARFTISRTWGFFEHAEVIASDTRLPRPPRNPTHVDVLSFPSSETAKNATPHLSEIPPPAGSNIALSSSAICPTRVAKSTGSPGWSVLDSDVGRTRLAGSYSTAYVKPVFASSTFTAMQFQERGTISQGIFFTLKCPLVGVFDDLVLHLAEPGDGIGFEADRLRFARNIPAADD